MKELILSTTAYRILAGDAEKDRLSHAYMLCFNDPKNMREALKIFALAFFGVDENSSVGSRILHESFTDFKIYPEADKKFNTEAVSEILNDCAMKPVEGKRKLYCICGFESAPALLQNKLLKTLEEPLEGVYFILGAASLASVLDTVKSRVKLLEIASFSEEQIYSALERKRPSAVNRRAAASANGILGAAENLAEGGWFDEIQTAAREICSVTETGAAGPIAVKYGDTKYKNELLCEMQRLYFAALNGEEELPLKKPAVIFALEKLCAAFNDLKFNAVFQGLLYDFILNVVKENKKWQKLSA